MKAFPQASPQAIPIPSFLFVIIDREGSKKKFEWSKVNKLSCKITEVAYKKKCTVYYCNQI